MTQARTILLVEDNAGDARLVAEACGECGVLAELQVAETAAVAFNRLGPPSGSPDIRLPDLVILDLDLPVMDGHAILAAIRSSAAWQALPVLIFSSSNRAVDRELALGQDIVTYVVKPRTWDQYLEFAQRIKRFLEALPQDIAATAVPGSGASVARLSAARHG